MSIYTFCPAYLSEKHFKELAFEFTDAILADNVGWVKVEARKAYDKKTVIMTIENEGVPGSEQEIGRSRYYSLFIETGLKITFNQGQWFGNTQQEIENKFNGLVSQLQQLLEDILIKATDRIKGREWRKFSGHFLKDSSWRTILYWKREEITVKLGL
jgi:hypothetical protein